MTVYRWGPQSPLEKMEVLPFGKEREAILYASASADPARLADISNMFLSQGLAVVPDEIDGQHVLRLRGFGKEELPAAALEQNGFVSKADRKTEEPKAAKEKINPLAAIRKSSFRMSGWVYMVGDAALAASGLKRGDVNETMSGLAFGATSVVAARYGERRKDKVFDDLHSRMIGEFARDGVELPQGDKLTAKELGKPGGIINRIEDFLYDYPVEVMTAGNAIAGFNVFRAGVNQSNVDKQIAGALVTTGMLIGLLVPQKDKEKAAPTPEEMAANAAATGEAKDVWATPKVEEKKGFMGTLLSPLQSVAGWVQEKPLRVGGYMAMANNVFSVKGALAERKANPLQRGYLEEMKNGNQGVAEWYADELKGKMAGKDLEEFVALDPSTPQGKLDFDKMENKLNRAEGMWKMNLVAASSYMVANGLLSISNKGAQGKDEKGKDPNAELYAAAAAIIANQPQEVQEQAIGKMAAFLGSQREIDCKPEELAVRIREKVEAVKDSPWLNPEIRAQRTAAHPAVPQELPLSVQEQDLAGKRWADAAARDAVPNAAWAEKEVAREAAAQDAGLTGAGR